MPSSFSFRVLCFFIMRWNAFEIRYTLWGFDFNSGKEKFYTLENVNKEFYPGMLVPGSIPLMLCKHFKLFYGVGIFRSRMKSCWREYMCSGFKEGKQLWGNNYFYSKEFANKFWIVAEVAGATNLPQIYPIMNFVWPKFKMEMAEHFNLRFYYYLLIRLLLWLN